MGKLLLVREFMTSGGVDSEQIWQHLPVSDSCRFSVQSDDKKR
jgi:hypothetical protein